MEEELSENELEEQMYAMIHYVDETQANVNTNPKDNNIIENVPQSTVRRYWRTNIDQNTPYQKINIAKESTTHKETTENSHSKTRDDKSKPTDLNSSDLSIFQQPVSSNVKKTVKILEHEDDKCVVELESSDEDEVIEVALPPKPTITIESSDEDDICQITTELNLKKEEIKPIQESKSIRDREVTASPVPSVVSSISDDFIRGDCIALNISSKHPSNESFDFSLHGSDLLDQTPSKKKKKKKNKDAATPISNPISVSTPVSVTPIVASVEECFATPKSKAKKKRQRTKAYRVSEKSIPNPDVYDSDSNQSISESNKNQKTYSVTDTSLPNTDVYESDSNPSEAPTESSNKESPTKEATNDVDSSDSNATETLVVDTPRTPKKTVNAVKAVVDLTEPDLNTTINENIVMANVTGFTDMEEYMDDNTTIQDISKCGSTKIPAILNEDLDFDNLKGSNKMCKRRRYSLSTLRAEMEKFYNESWGGEEFNHREIQKNMSRDKSLWLIDPKDRMPSLSRRKVTCNYCNRPGHRDDTCHFKPAVCFMCGDAGHYEPRCPRKICVNCGSPNYVYSTMCRNCSTWKSINCAECGQNGHPSSHCPDIWRRYHDTLYCDTLLEENRQTKKNYQMFCSGCTRRGHLVHTCRLSLPFSGLPINSPYVSIYRPVYQMFANSNTQNDCGNKKHKNRNNSEESSIPKQDRLKRQSKSPSLHETHLNKKRNVGLIEVEVNQGIKSPINSNPQRKVSLCKDQPNTTSKNSSETNTNKKIVSEAQSSEKAPDFIPISSENHDKQGQMIQDNEVSDTSEVITSARVYITKEISDKLMTEEGNLWLNTSIKNNDLILENEKVTFYMSINGTVGNQEAFQSELKEWIKSRQFGKEKERFVSESEADVTQDSIGQSTMSNNIPKNRNNALRKLNKAFDSLKKDLGDPKTLYKELMFLQNKHQQLVNQKVISPKQLTNNKDNMNVMLRKLNMVLLGQAGLADGRKHLNELYSLQEKLTNFRQKNIPPSMRVEIGEHFHCIFTAIPRDDYTELLSKFYNKPPSITFKKKNDKSFKVSPKPNQKTLNLVQNLQRNAKVAKDDAKENNIIINDTSQLIAATKNKLVFYQRRLVHSRPVDAVLKKTKKELIRKLHMNIALLGDKTHMPARALKKMRKIQEQAQLFLTNF